MGKVDSLESLVPADEDDGAFPAVHRVAFHLLLQVQALHAIPHPRDLDDGSRPAMVASEPRRARARAALARRPALLAPRAVDALASADIEPKAGEVIELNRVAPHRAGGGDATGRVRLRAAVLERGGWGRERE